MSPQRQVVAAYLALLGWQPAWLLLLPPPAGPRSPLLALLVTVPLLVPLRGVLSGRVRALTWAGFLAVACFVIGVTEAWSNPGMRAAAVVQVLLSLAYVAALAHHLRGPRRNGRDR